MCNHRWLGFGSDSKGNYRICGKCGKIQYEGDTNEDRLKAMNINELAEELALIATWDRTQVAKAQRTIGLVEFMKKWLQSEAKEG